MSVNAKRKIGIIGGGQLGLMLIKHGFTPEERENVFIRVLDPDPDCSCASVADELIVGSLTGIGIFEDLIHDLDIVTYEIEHISVEELKRVSRHYPNVEFVPSIETLETIQSKVVQKRFYEANGIPTLPFKVVNDLTVYDQYSGVSTEKCVWKSDRGGYDGKGVRVLNPYDMPHAEGLVELSAGKGVQEFSVNVVLDGGNVYAYPPTKMVVHPELNMLDYCMSTDSQYESELMDVARRCTALFNSDGLFAVEMFLTNDGKVYVNEVAPRPHNSSHPLIHAYPDSSPYRLLARRLMGYFYTAPQQRTCEYVMKNILGPEYMRQHVKYRVLSLTDDPNVHVVDYNKSETRPNRKIGHVTYTTEDSDFHERLGGVSLRTFVSTLESGVLVVPEGGVAVVMGSTSDWPVMKAACEILDELGVPYAKSVVSAHRTPDRLRLFGKRAREAGLRCIIAGAGGAAHLPGMLAAYTELPVIGVPVKSERSALNGVDALHSIVQMPPGVPVASVAINGAKNAGILAAQIAGYLDEVREYKDSMEGSVLLRANELK